PQGKGRPTPKRRDAERRRKARVNTPQNRKEATKLQREEAKRRRVEARDAMTGKGDLSKLPPRDAGPVRAFVRDYIDRRHTAGVLFLPAAFVVFGLGAAGLQVVANALLLLVILAIGFDTRRISKGVGREVLVRFPNAETKGLTMYAVTRALQIRRLRMPKPRV